MAESSFSLDTLLGWLKSFLNSMPSPMSGFDMKNVKVNEKGDVFSSLFTFEASPELLKDQEGNELTDIGGNKIQLNVLMRVLNARDALKPLFTALNNISPTTVYMLQNDVVGKSPLLEVFLGKDRKDNTLETAIKDKKGLLGVKLDDSFTFDSSKDVTFNGKVWSWSKIAGEYLSYGLECKVPDRDYGAIDNVSLDRCSELISEYLVKMNIITNAEEVKVDTSILVLPVLNEVQKMLREYYNAAYQKYIKGEPVDAPKEQEGENPNQTENPNPDQSQGENPDQSGQPTGDGDVKQTKHIDVTLQGITGSTSFNMTAIKANYDPSLVLEDMDEILGQPEFINSLSVDEPTTYSIDVDDDGFDISECKENIECNPCESLCEVFKAGIRAYRNLYILHWMSHGNDMMKLHLMTEEMYEELQGEIDTLGELLVEKQGTVPQLDFPCDYIPVQQYDFQTGLDQIKSLIQMYIDCIDYAYCNQDSDVQSTLDEWLRYWNKQLNYFVKGQEI